MTVLENLEGYTPGLFSAHFINEKVNPEKPDNFIYENLLF